MVCLLQRYIHGCTLLSCLVEMNLEHRDFIVYTHSSVWVEYSNAEMRWHGTFCGDCSLESNNLITIVVDSKIHGGHLESASGAVRARA